MTTSTVKINQRIEAVCEAGCGVVRASIKTLELGQETALIDDLNHAERQQVLMELKSLMSIYDQD